MEAVRVDDAAAFLEEAGPLLLADEARHNLILGLAGNLRDGVYGDFRLWLVRDCAEVAAAALQTPPYNLVLARPSSTESLVALVEAIASEELPGVVGSVPEIEEFVELWSLKTGETVRTNMRQGVYALEQVTPPLNVPGSSRVATVNDRELALGWWIAFGEETLHEGGPGRDRAEVMFDYRLSSPASGIFLWEDGGEPVSLAGWGGPTPTGIRIGRVYTPPELRGHGYATALTAELSQRLLDGRLFEGGRRFCFLYTDLANPTSNAIYERIGYRRVAESAEIVFSRPMDGFSERA
jgi:predicted GNAT family acetyltransferase